jgi:copper chaperone CopZ
MKKILHLCICLIGLTSLAGASPSSDVKPYPLDRCIVSDEKLGSMGEPVVFVYEGQEIKLCCKACRKDFDAEPQKFLEKIKNGGKESKKSSTSEGQASGGTVVKLTVDGLVCNFCASNITKTFSKLPEISAVYVNLAAKTVLLELKAGQKLPEDKAKEIVTEAGFNLRGVTYPKESFDSIKEGLKKSSK